ncbi:hypothetical protein AAVH_23680 [Aphelenchoides avenae]|nr:hypothetical protein AAVH_23680 [Aphelenchus avenae]
MFILVIMSIERALSRNFLFAVNRAGKGNFVRLHYNVRGDKNSAVQSAACKFVRCRDCGDLLYFEGGSLARHADAHERKQTKRKPEAPIEPHLSSPLTAEEKSAVTNVLARYAIQGGVSFRSLAKPAFAQAAISLMNIGAKRKKEVVEPTLVDRTTIARRDVVNILGETVGAIAADYGKRLED